MSVKQDAAKWLCPALLVGIAALLGGCSWFSDQEDAGAAKTLPPLEVPPDLLHPAENPQFVLPEVPKAAKPAAPAAAPSAEPPTLGERVLPPGQGVQRVRDGQHRWLLVSAEPEQVWPLARKFLEMRGYRVAKDEPAIGLLETDWKERFTDADNNGKPNWRERLRIRLEPAAQAGSTEVYVTQASSERVSADGGEQWVLRAPDNERAVEMLNRLARYLAAEDVEDAVPLTPLESSLDVDEDNNVALFVEAPVETVWRRIGIALDGLGFVIEDQDSGSHIYHVYNEVPSGKTEEEIKYGKPEPAMVREYFQLHLHADGQRTVVAVHNKSGQRDTSGVAQHILNLLHGQLQ